MSTIKCISHIAYQVHDLEKSLYFYCDILGFKQKCTLYMSDRIEMLERKMDDRTDEQRRELIEALTPVRDRVWLTYVEIVENRQFLELLPIYNELPEQDKRPGYSHLALEVEDIQKTLETLKARGATIKGGYALGIDNTYESWLADPDGNSIELMQYTGRSMQITGKV